MILHRYERRVHIYELNVTKHEPTKMSNGLTLEL